MSEEQLEVRSQTRLLVLLTLMSEERLISTKGSRAELSEDELGGRSWRIRLELA